MDFISSINTAFTQVHRRQQMSVSAGDDPSRNQIQHRKHETHSRPFGQIDNGRKLGHLQRPGATVENLRDAIQNAVAYDRTERGSLQLRTREGDVVQLKFLNTESTNAQSQQFESGGTLVSSFSLDGGNSSNFQVVVDGDLNGHELSAIRDVLIQAREMANAFYDGDVQSAFKIANDFEIDSQQLANASMRLSLHETYTYSHASLAPQNPHNPDVMPGVDQIQAVTPAADPAPAVVPVGMDPKPVDVTTAVSLPDVAATAPVTDTPPDIAVTPVTPDVIETPVHVAPDVADNLAGALSTITDFLSQLSATLDAFNQQFQNPDLQSPWSFSNGFRLQMVSALVSQMDSPNAEKPFEAHALAAATIDEVAMKMDAHVENII